MAGTVQPPREGSGLHVQASYTGPPVSYLRLSSGPRPMYRRRMRVGPRPPGSPKNSRTQKKRAHQGERVLDPDPEAMPRRFSLRSVPSFLTSSPPPSPSLRRLHLATPRLARLLVEPMLLDIAEDPRTLNLAPELPQRAFELFIVT